MLELIKGQLRDELMKKDISLGMIYDRKGEILWHRGRPIEGSTIQRGTGFPKNLIQKHTKTRDTILEQNIPANIFRNRLSASALALALQTVVIIPLGEGIFLYLDSGNREEFSEPEIRVFKVLGSLLGKTLNSIRDETRQGNGITGSSGAAEQLREMLFKYAIEEAPLLLTGETGSGKTRMAELIHRYSGRRGKFVTAEMTSIPENLFESIIFGHRRGAFTDARENRDGLVSAAEGGTLFIDEVADIPPGLQSKLLRLIDTRRYRILGDSGERRADIRIVAATSRDLGSAMGKNHFRNDLYYRLQVLEIHIPPLRERKEDIREFVNEHIHLLKGKQPGNGFWEILLSHHWPGNYRELINVLKRAGILLDDPVTGDEIKKIISGSLPPDGGIGTGEKIRQIWDLLRSGENFWTAVREPFLNRDLNREQVQQFIRQGLKRSGQKYVNMLPMLNLDRTEYHKFICFLNDHQLK